LNAAAMVGLLCFSLALWAVWHLKESFDASLDFLE